MYQKYVDDELTNRGKEVDNLSKLIYIKQKKIDVREDQEKKEKAVQDRIRREFEQSIAVRVTEGSTEGK